MTEPEDPEVIAMRERAERVMARRAKERAERPAEEEPARANTKPSKAKSAARRWATRLFDVALIALAAYMIKTRFFDKQPEQPAAPAPAARASGSASPSASPSVATRASADLLEHADPGAPRLEALPPNTALEVLELSNAGYMKVKTPSGKTGWVLATNVQMR